jgi:hypothetical protein
LQLNDQFWNVGRQLAAFAVQSATYVVAFSVIQGPLLGLKA